MAELVGWCESRNNSNSELLRINHNSWIEKSEATPNDLERAKKYTK